MTKKIAPKVGTVFETMEDLANVSALWLYEAMYDDTTLQNVDACAVYWSDYGDFDHFPWEVIGIPEGFTGEEEPENTWQPIETAPTDRPIQLFKNGEQYVGQWVKSIETGHVAWSIGNYSSTERAIVEDPTHWMPLLSPPSEKEQG